MLVQAQKVVEAWSFLSSFGEGGYSHLDEMIETEKKKREVEVVWDGLVAKVMMRKERKDQDVKEGVGDWQIGYQLNPSSKSEGNLRQHRHHLYLAYRSYFVAIPKKPANSVSLLSYPDRKSVV